MQYVRKQVYHKAPHHIIELSTEMEIVTLTMIYPTIAIQMGMVHPVDIFTKQYNKFQVTHVTHLS